MAFSLLSYNVGFFIRDLSYVRAGDLLSVSGSNESYRVSDSLLYRLVVIGGEGLVTGLEVEYLTVNSLPKCAGAEYLAA